MDKARLAQRNRRLAEFQHRLSWRERLRRVLLRLYAVLPSPRIQKPMRGTFLLIRPDHLGDVLLTTPAIQALKRAQPSARLVGLVGGWSSEALAAYPEVDLVLTMPFPGFSRQPKRGSLITPYILAWEWAGKLRQLRAETAIVFRPDHWWGALLAYLAGIPRRVGYDLPDVRPFLTERMPYQPRHAALQGLGLVEPWTGPLQADNVPCTFPVAQADREHIRETLAEFQIPPIAPIVVIHPGAGTALKRWLPEHWAAVADRLSERLGASIIFTGSDREHGQVWEIMDKMRRRAHSLVGETNIGQLAALFERATVVLGPDSGPLHLAAASGAATVHLYGPADPGVFGPWGDPHRQVILTSDIACRPCNILDWPEDDPMNHPCIRDITPGQVFHAAARAAELAAHR